MKNFILALFCVLLVSCAPTQAPAPEAVVAQSVDQPVVDMEYARQIVEQAILGGEKGDSYIQDQLDQLDPEGLSQLKELLNTYWNARSPKVLPSTIPGERVGASYVRLLIDDRLGTLPYDAILEGHFKGSIGYGSYGAYRDFIQDDGTIVTMVNVMPGGITPYYSYQVNGDDIVRLFVQTRDMEYLPKWVIKLEILKDNSSGSMLSSPKK